MGSDRWSDPHIRPLAYWVGAIVAENAKCKLLTLPSPGSLALPKTVNKKSDLIPGDMAENNATINNLKDEGVVGPYCCPI